MNAMPSSAFPHQKWDHEQGADTQDSGQKSPIILTKQDKWRKLFELQRQSMKELIKTLKNPQEKA